MQLNGEHHTLRKNNCMVGWVGGVNREADVALIRRCEENLLLKQLTLHNLFEFTFTRTSNWNKEK